jgi:hypothetical protein
MLLGVLLAGCSDGGKPAPSPRQMTASVRSRTVVVPEVRVPAGLGDVISAPATALTRRFGTPRIVLAEGDARKLQFAGSTCVVDIFLYPVAASVEPTATHVEARLRQGGAPIDPLACIREVEGG